MKDIITLEELVERYPWYSLAHLELYKKMCEKGGEFRLAYLEKAATHIYSRKKLIVPVTEESEFTFELVDEPVVENSGSKIIIAGGDYFSKNDFAELELDKGHSIDRFIMERPSISRAGEEDSEIITNQDKSEIFEADDFYTETLAKIYAEQGFYKRAIEVYAKLILLYPEKSAYFASLAQEIKKKNNQ